jgi:RNA polymerase sigma-70 factor (ECF subfamily)
LELAYYGGFTQSELAERLGQPLGTIKSRMFSGLGQLRDLLAEPGNGERTWEPTPSTT